MDASGLVVSLLPHLVATVVAVTSLLTCLRRKRASERSSSEESPNMSSSQRPVAQLRPLATDASSLNSDVSMRSVRGNSAAHVLHIDKSDTIVPSKLTDSEMELLIQSIVRSSSMSEGVTRAKQSPVVDKVITFGTADDITILEPNAVSPSLSADDCTQAGLVEPLLLKMIRNGPCQFPFDAEELADVLSRAAALFGSESSLLEVPVPCVVYGDLHGQYSDLHRWFNLNGWPHRIRSVFLGDFVDRGTHGIEVIALISALKLSFPNQVFVLRGNHEEETLNRAYSFHAEVCHRFDDSGVLSGADMYAHFKRLFVNLPLAVLIGKRILCMHGGISPKLTSLDEVRAIKRPIEDFEVGSLACDLVWSDPETNTKQKQFRPNLEREPRQGIGQLFTAKAVKEICDRLGVDLVIRGHQAPLHGYAFFAGCHLLTIFSAPGYKGITASDVNMGASLEINADMRLTIRQLKVSEQFRQKRVNDAERLKKLMKAKQAAAA
ncbi:serine/threonine-protein phosphatase [Aphelenchoides avenae]|nr:serine/threonine-protein phosphatase [Aphelenchus avenae]